MKYLIAIISLFTVLGIGLFLWQNNQSSMSAPDGVANESRAPTTQPPTVAPEGNSEYRSAQEAQREAQSKAKREAERRYEQEAAEREAERIAQQASPPEVQPPAPQKPAPQTPAPQRPPGKLPPTSKPVTEKPNVEVRRYPTMESPAKITVDQAFTTMVSLTEVQLTETVEILQGQSDELGRLKLNLPAQTQPWEIDVVLSASGFDFVSPNKGKYFYPRPEIPHRPCSN